MIENEIEDDNEETEAESIEVNTLDLLKIKDKNFSQDQKETVNNTKTKTMDLEQILSALKTVLAEKQETTKFSEEAVASISAEIAERIKLKNEEIKAEISAAETAKLQALAETEKVKKELEENNNKLNETLARLGELENTLSAQAAQEIFNSRMSTLDSEYDLDEIDRNFLAKEIGALEKSDEAFASYKEKLAVVYRHKSKAFKSEQDKAFQDRLEAELAKRLGEVKAQASVTKEAVEKTVAVETALANAKPEESSIPAQNVNPTEGKGSWKEKFSKAFSKENITIKL